MPVLFVGHGNPMNAILENEFTEGWKESAQNLPTPNLILCISAHWETKGTRITAMEHPRTIYDMYGFPKELYEVEYACPGSPELAQNVSENIESHKIDPDHEWGLDHGTWSVLTKMYPEANIPVVQLSLDRTLSPQEHYNLATQLSYLRRKGVLIIGSGNIVHNLRMADLRNDDQPYDWAIEFDELSRDLIKAGEHQKLINYKTLGHAANLSIPTAEHYLPLLYTLALQEKDDSISFFNEQIAFRSGSMTSVKIE